MFEHSFFCDAYAQAAHTLTINLNAYVLYVRVFVRPYMYARVCNNTSIFSVYKHLITSITKIESFEKPKCLEIRLRSPLI